MIMMTNKTIHKADSRGHENHGWLDTYHTFSFAGYYDSRRIHFGALRVLNDDTVLPGMGFGTHPHNDMEIVSIPLEGDLEHRDSMGNVAVIRKGEVQVMSAGTGITHSEYNKNRDRPVKFLQIWVFPREQGLTPRYSQVALDEAAMDGNLAQIVSPDKDDAGAWIHQDAWFHMGNLLQGRELEYKLKREGDGVYIFVLEGNLEAEGEKLTARDGIALWNGGSIALKALDDTSVLVMEVPMR